MSFVTTGINVVLVTDFHTKANGVREKIGFQQIEFMEFRSPETITDTAI